MDHFVNKEENKQNNVVLSATVQFLLHSSHKGVDKDPSLQSLLMLSHASSKIKGTLPLQS